MPTTCSALCKRPSGQRVNGGGLIRRVWRHASLLLGVLVLPACGSPAAGASPASAHDATAPGHRHGEAPPLRVQFLDVGQGDAALITTPEGRHLLVDAGPDDRTVADLLRQWHVDTIDLAIASHNHADHIGGMAAVLRGVVVRSYMESGVPTTTATYRDVLNAVEREPGLQFLRPTARTITLGSAQLRVLAPSQVDASLNNNSVGVEVALGAARVLFTGDAEGPELEAWQRAGQLSPVTILKSSHHGSRNGMSAAFARAVAPQVVVMSVGAGNRYHHPSPAVEQAWRARGAAVWRTDQQGTIEVRVWPEGRVDMHSTHQPTWRTP